MLKRNINITLLMVVFPLQALLCQTNDLKQTMHERVQKFLYGDPELEDVRAMQKTFANYRTEEIANALIADIDVDRGSISLNDRRDVTVNILYKALNLPPIFVCKQLETEKSPQRKVQLMTVLRGINTPEVTQAFLNQLQDRRPAAEFNGLPEEPVYPLRVCDVACNVLNHNLDPNPYARRIIYSCPYDRRDKIIAQTLHDLNLNSAK